MSKNNKLVVKENFDEDLSDDVDDEVFVRDGKTHSMKIEKHKGDEQPLMPVRRKSRQRQNVSSPEVCSRQPCNIYNCLLPVYFGVAAIISIAFLMLLYIFLVNKLPLLVNKMGLWPMESIRDNNSLTPCTNFKLSPVWSQKIPKILSDSQIRLIDVDKDGVNDIVIGTGTELEDATSLDRHCNHDYCLGGVIAINGKTGSMLWKVWLPKMVLAVHCDYDITADEVPDCVVTGKGGLLLTVNGADGTIIWEWKPVSDYELYNILVSRDVNEDGILDIIASHYSKSIQHGVQSSISVISGKGDKTLYQLHVPSFEPILHAPQIITDLDGSEYLIFVTGDLNNAGGLYMISMHDFLSEDNTKVKTLNHFDTGILAAPIMVDVNLDGVHDILFSTTNKIFAVDGQTYAPIWNTSLNDFVPGVYQITSTSSVTPAYFDDDRIPDILVTFSVGSTFPEYYYSVILVLDGKNGHSLLKEPIIRSSVPDTVGAISLSFSGMGNDAFIYWTASCKNFVDAKSSFSFAPLENRQFFADLCYLRFNTTFQLELFALNQHVQPPGVLLKSESSYDNWDYNVKENPYLINEPVPVLYKISPRGKTFSRPKILPSVLGNNDDKQYPNIMENKFGNAWKSSSSRYSNNGEPIIGENFNDNPPDQAQISDYGSDNDISINDHNEKDYDLPIHRAGARVLRNTQNPKISLLNNKMLPKVSASGVLTKPLSGDILGQDLILMHYEVKTDPSICIVINKEEKCGSKHVHFNSKANKQYRLPTTNKLQDKMLANSLLYDTNEKYNDNSFKASNTPISNLYIFRYHLTCSCVYFESEKGTSCSTILPYETQSYPSYLGYIGNSAFKHREPTS